MTALLTGLASLLVFSSVILVHELGHFMAADRKSTRLNSSHP